LLEAGEILGSIPVLGGAEEYVQAVADAPFTLPVSRSEVVTYRLNTPVFVFAPVLAGDPAGTVSVLIDGIETAKVPLYWRYSVMEGA